MIKVQEFWCLKQNRIQPTKDCSSLPAQLSHATPSTEKSLRTRPRQSLQGVVRVIKPDLFRSRWDLEPQEELMILWWFYGDCMVIYDDFMVVSNQLILLQTCKFPFLDGWGNKSRAKEKKNRETLGALAISIIPQTTNALKFYVRRQPPVRFVYVYINNHPRARMNNESQNEISL